MFNSRLLSHTASYLNLVLEVGARKLSTAMPDPRLICIVGATGVGKSKLGIELAQELNGEVINADVVQMYKGLDIATAKVTEEEAQGIKHHILSVLDPETDSFTVQDFRNKALELIDDIHQRGKQPIVVGGTLYYVQSLLWPSLIDEVETSRVEKPNKEKIDLNTDYTYDRLLTIDPEMAKQLHPHDTRKIRRSIEVFETTGEKHSVLIQKQQKSRLEDKARFNAILLWPSCKTEVHRERLNSRVEKMMDSGLLEEASEFIKKLKTKKEGFDDKGFKTGIFQAIGYKEFFPLLDAGDAENKEEILSACVDRLKIHHRQYSKRQLQWIKNRMLPRNVPVFELDTSDVSQWEEYVYKPARKVCKAFIESPDWTPEKVPKIPHAVLRNMKRDDLGRHKQERFVCDICNGKLLLGKQQWETHLRSKAHRSLKRKRDNPQIEYRSKKNSSTNS